MHRPQLTDVLKKLEGRNKLMKNLYPVQQRFYAFTFLFVELTMHI